MSARSSVPARTASAPATRIFAAPGERGEIMTMLASLRLDTHVRPWAEPEDDGRPSPRGALNIVSDAMDDPLDLCRSLAFTGPVILISEGTGFEFRLAAARNGVKAILGRPVEPAQMAGWLAHFMRADIAGPLTIAVVDDDRLMAELNAEILRAAGMTVDVAAEPSLALEMIERLCPDLVLMDLRMPEVDGLELAQVIRQSSRFASMPIVFLSAERDEALQTAARRVGGDDFIQKPVNPSKLVVQVRLRAERARALRAMIERDGLTGLLNHSRFHEHLAHELERGRRSGAVLSVAMIDVDHFKGINDRYGHPGGDGVLRGLANLLRASLRRIDIVCRYGGEEFAVIFLDTDAGPARGVLDAIREVFAASPFAEGEGSFQVTFSAGVASSRDHGSVEDIVAAADKALYDAKAAGRNRVVEASPRALCEGAVAGRPVAGREPAA